MRKLILIPLLFSTLLQPLTEDRTIEIGDPLPMTDLELVHANGEKSELGSLKGEKGILIVFAANECVAVKYWYDRLIETGNKAEQNGIKVLWVNSNKTQREAGESLEEMAQFAREKKLPFDYVIEDNFQLADHFDARVTPTSYLFDQDFKLVYKGIVDNNMTNSDAATEHYLDDAISATVKGGKVPVPVKLGRGCRIPRN
ncbi:hypothetical protein BFP97_07270 [Roseivirga sp. 4D4]|uniref:redoxin domain-containing protein n=1 Tax=Roseivirga sp. 4D4 TaxID=1889784 RepID=UPI000852D6AD|nr:redoxin domain-containing protein [Roseivirga sp. 4D4]OEK01327.1 hypothetical protein BFP97_07270 [Roseivirga sp. 4D4]